MSECWWRENSIKGLCPEFSGTITFNKENNVVKINYSFESHRKKIEEGFLKLKNNILDRDISHLPVLVFEKNK